MISREQVLIAELFPEPFTNLQVFVVGSDLVELSESRTSSDFYTDLCVSALLVTDAIMICTAQWRARIGLFVPKSTCPRRELLVRHVEKLSPDVDVVHLLLTLVMSSVTSKAKMLVGDVHTNADHQQNHSKYRKTY